MAKDDAAGGGPILLGCCGLIIVIGLGITFLCIGALHLHDCPVEPLIPVFLVVYGATLLLIVGAEIMFWVCKGSASIVALVLRVIGGIFCFAWMIAGCVWVLRTDALSPAACDPVVYKAAFALVIIAIISWSLSLLKKLCSCLCSSE